MKFLSKNENYYSLKGNQGLFKNPYVQTTKTEIDTRNQKLVVNFSLLFEQNEIEKHLETNSLTFTEAHIETLIEDANGNPVEIITFLSGGGTYDVTKIVQWGTPSFTSVQSYFDLDSVWSDLQFKDTPFKQLAIDWVIHNVMIEGVALKEYFELEVQ